MDWSLVPGLVKGRIGLIKVWFFLIAILFSENSKAAYFEYTQNLKDCQHYLTTLRLKQAEVMINAEISKHPDNVAAWYLLNYSNFYRIMVHYDKSMLDAYLRINNGTIAKIQELPDASPYKLFLKGSVHLQSAFVKGAFNEYLSAAWDFRTAYQEINLNEKKFPGFLSHKKELGALMALIGTFPKQYQFAVNAVGLEGDFDRGLRILKDYIDFSRNEPLIEQQQANVIYTLILLNFGPEKKKAWEYIKDRSNNYQQNLIECYLRAFVAGKCGANEIALQTLKARPQDESYEQIMYFNFLMGEYLVHELEYSAAIWFKKYVTFSKTKSSFKEAYQKLSWIAWMQNDTVKFLAYNHLMIKNTKDIGSEQRLINEDLRKGVYPSVELIKSRLLCDGGYYNKALSILLKVKPEGLKSKFQRLESAYRFARIYQEENKIREAIEQYLKCIESGKGMHSYIIPNACLQLGIIYEDLKYPDLAKSYYNKVLGFSNYDYENSIHQKAKAGILRLKD